MLPFRQILNQWLVDSLLNWPWRAENAGKLEAEKVRLVALAGNSGTPA